MTIRRLPIDLSSKYPFDLNKVLNGTQDFRWRKRDDGWHCGVLAGHHIHVRQSGDVLEYCSRSDSGLNGLLHSYFRLDDDIDAIYDYISSQCDTVARLVEKYPSHRILRQPDRWECMVAYICSANKNILDIRRNVESMACRIGKPLELNGETRHAFPTPEMVLAAGVGPLEELRLGLNRHCKIVKAAERVVKDDLNLCRLAKPDICYGEAKSQLMQKCGARRKVANGIGDKVANCIALFSLEKMDAFPVDTHVREALKRCGCSPPPPSSETAIVKWAQERFDNYAGYANQLLFKGAWDESQQSRRKEKGSNSQLRLEGDLGAGGFPIPR